MLLLFQAFFVARGHWHFTLFHLGAAELMFFRSSNVETEFNVCVEDRLEDLFIRQVANELLLGKN